MSNWKIAVQGLPYDESSSYLKGCRDGPTEIRKAFHCSSANYFTESRLDLNDHPSIVDQGDLDLHDQPIAMIEQQTEQRLSDGFKVLSLGGDHFVTFPILKAYASKYGKVNLVQFDAHPDLYDELDGNRNSHACPFARSHEANLIRRHLQIGIRTMNTHQYEQAERFGVEVLPFNQSSTLIELDGPTYITLDLDVLDPAFAPGISHHEPGGLSVREVLNWLQSLKADVVGADIVELNPSRDFNGVTAMVAAKFYKEILGKMLAP